LVSRGVWTLSVTLTDAQLLSLAALLAEGAR